MGGGLDIKRRRWWGWGSAFLTCLTVLILLSLPAVAADDPVSGYNQEIEDRKSEIEKIKKRIELYQQRIKESQKESATLRGQLRLLENDIAKKELDIELTKKQIAKTNLEIQRTAGDIETQGEKIDEQRVRLRQLLQLIYQNDQVSYLEIMVTNETFSDFFDYYQRLQDVQEHLQQALQKLKNLQAELELQQQALVAKRTEQEQYKTTLEDQRQDLTEHSAHQENLLKETERSEKKFSSYVQELKLEQQQLNSDIVGIEKKIRAELERRQEAERFNALGKPRLRWPTDGRYITAYFRDPEYPYRHIFEHPAIDIRTPQGSKVYAAEAGYVAKVKDGGARGYSYVMLIHNDGIATVYGHVSRIEVQEKQFVTKGQVIARSGGAPGTRGAGPLTTGPHLHFEVRANSIPTNPLEYLP